MARRPTRAPGTGVATSSNDGQGAMTEKKHLLDFPHVSHRDGIHSYFKLHANDAHVREGGAGTSWSVPKLCEAYGWPNKELKGRGVIAIIEVNGGWLQSDMEKYFAGIGQPLPTIIDVSVDGTNNSKCETASGDDAEVALDIQVAAASYFVATGKPATIKVYWSKDIAAAIRRATSDRCAVCSISWGADEALWPIGAAMGLERAAEAAVNAGMIVFAAAGDNASTDGGLTPANVDLPASAPHAIACGGTTKPRAGAQETVWNNDPEQTIGRGTGGGFSTLFMPMPLWQAGAPHGPGRMVPDVAANADPNTGYEIFVDGQPRVFGGNSAGRAAVRRTVRGVRHETRVRHAGIVPKGHLLQRYHPGRQRRPAGEEGPGPLHRPRHSEWQEAGRPVCRPRGGGRAAAEGEGRPNRPVRGADRRDPDRPLSMPIVCVRATDPLSTIGAGTGDMFGERLSQFRGSV